MCQKLFIGYFCLSPISRACQYSKVTGLFFFSFSSVRPWNLNFFFLLKNKQSKLLSYQIRKCSFLCTSGMGTSKKRRGRPSIVTIEETGTLVIDGLSHRHHPSWILFLFSFLLLTWRLSLNYPAAVLIVWILGREQWRGYSIRRVGKDVAPTGWGTQTHTHTHVKYFWFLLTAQNNYLMSKNTNDVFLFLKHMPRKYSAKEAAHKPWENGNAPYIYNNILQLQEVGRGRGQKMKWLWTAWATETKL